MTNKINILKNLKETLIKIVNDEMMSTETREAARDALEKLKTQLND